jgi:CelD/BcsL family acetyltransferase involved in cellulose biosynthesis
MPERSSSEAGVALSPPAVFDDSRTQYDITVARTTEQIEKIRPIWAQWNAHPNSDIDFYLWLQAHRSEIVRPHVVVLERGGKPTAMLVGRILAQRVEFRIGYLTLPGPKVRQLNFVWGGALGDLSPENSNLLVAEVVNSLRRREVDVAVFNNLRVDSTLHQAALSVPDWLSRDRFPSFNLHRSMVLPGSVEKFYAGLSKKVRKNQKWQAKKLLEDFGGKVRVECCQEEENFERMIRDVEAIAAKTYQRGLGVGFADNSENRVRLLQEAREGRLRMHMLYLADQPAAFWIGSIYQRTFHSGYMGYDPTYHEHSPGMYLLMRVIEDMCADRIASGIEEIDFGLGDAQYKQVLGNVEWQDAEVRIFAPTIRGFLLNALRTLWALLDRLARRALGHAGLLSKVKNRWRHSVRAH